MSPANLVATNASLNPALHIPDTTDATSRGKGGREEGVERNNASSSRRERKTEACLAAGCTAKVRQYTHEHR